MILSSTVLLLQRPREKLYAPLDRIRSWRPLLPQQLMAQPMQRMTSPTGALLWRHPLLMIKEIRGTVQFILYAQSSLEYLLPYVASSVNGSWVLVYFHGCVVKCQYFWIFQQRTYWQDRAAWALFSEGGMVLIVEPYVLSNPPTHGGLVTPYGDIYLNHLNVGLPSV